MSRIHDLEQAILTVIEESECRPEQMIVAGQKAVDKASEYIQITFLGTTTRRQFAGNEEQQNLLIQIDIGVPVVAEHLKLNEYTDEMYRIFSTHNEINIGTVNSYPQQNTIGVLERSKHFRRVLTVSMRYFV